MESIGRVRPTAAAAAAARTGAGLGEGGLAVGQTVRARVVRVEGGAVQLRWGDQTLSVSSRVPLTVGQQVDLTVERGSAGQMLLRMVDATFGKGRPSDPDAGLYSRRPGAGPGVLRSGGGPAGRTTDAPSMAPSGGVPPEALGLPGVTPEGEVVLPAGSPLATAPSRASGPPPASGDALATLLFERLDGAAVRPGMAGPAAGGVLARAAMPTYGKLAQSVGGAAAFGQVLATLGHEAGRTLARAPLAPADLGRLLVSVGVHPDETNTVLVGELLAQGASVTEGAIRGLRRGIAAAGGSLSDAAPAVALSRLGLPITPLTLAVARQLLAGQLDPASAWGELLGELRTLARDAGSGSQAGALAAELLADWRVPLEGGAEGLARWLRAAVDQTATPLEAKLSRALVTPRGEAAPATTPGQDVRARLDLLGQALPPSARGERLGLVQALQRTQATIQAEQILNGASATDRAEPRFFAVTLPAIVGQQPSTLALRVRERDPRPRQPGEAAPPDLVQLRLSLPGLGDLGVSLMVGQHSVACHFSAASPFAEALLSATSSDLVGRLRRLGFAHTAVDAAHEPPPSTAPTLAPAPRVNHVDVQA